MHRIPTLLLLPVLASIILHAATAPTGTSCEPARCGDLTIKYPFSLHGKQPLNCGYTFLRLLCDDERNRTYLSWTFRSGDHLYRVADIFYDDSSLVVAVETTFRGDSSCRVPDFDVISSLSQFPLSISAENMNLVFVYDCNLPPSQRFPELSLLSCGVGKKMGAYLTQERDGSNSSWAQYLADICSFETVPVRGFAGASAGDYKRLINDGFLAEWAGVGDCRACEQSGGQCRVENDEQSGAKWYWLEHLQCFCRNGGDGLRCTNSTSGNSDLMAVVQRE